MRKTFLIVAVIALCLLLYYYFFIFRKSPKLIYDLEDFPPIMKLNQELLQNFDQVKDEALRLQDVPVSDIVIGKGAIYTPGENQKTILNKVRQTDSWTVGWDSGKGYDNWKQYPIIYKGEMFEHAKKRLPLICSLLEPIKDRFYTLFVSTIKPNGEIERHCDGGDRNNVSEKDRLTYHFNIDCPDTSILSVEDLEFVQQNRENIIFDSAFEHGVKNNSSLPRTILCAKFYISKCKKF
jgi:hypothetical protein